MDSLRVIENNTVRYDRAIVDYLFDCTSYFSSSDPDFKKQLVGLQTKAQKNASDDIIKRIKRDYPEKLGLSYALFREAMSKMTDQTASEQVRKDIQPLFAANPQKSQEEETYQALLNLRASGQDTEADQFENDLTAECIEFLQTKTLYFVKQGLFKATIDAIKKDSKSDCFQDIKTCFEPLLPARIGLAWALHIATVRCNHLECRIRQAFSDGEKQNSMEIKDLIADLKEIDATFEDADLDIVITILERNGNQPIEVPSLVDEIDQIENKEAKKQTRQVVLQFAQACSINDLESALKASDSQDQTQVQVQVPKEESLSSQTVQECSFEQQELEENLENQSDQAALSETVRCASEASESETQATPAQPDCFSEAPDHINLLDQPARNTDCLELLKELRKEKKQDLVVRLENELALEDPQVMHYLVFKTNYFNNMAAFKNNLKKLPEKLKKSDAANKINQSLKQFFPAQVGLAKALHLKIETVIKDQEVKKKLKNLLSSQFSTVQQKPIEGLRNLAAGRPKEPGLALLVSHLEQYPQAQRSFGDQILEMIQDKEVKKKATELFNSHFKNQPKVKSELQLRLLIIKLKNPSKQVLTEWVDSSFQSVPSTILKLSEAQMTRLHKDFFRIESQLKNSSFSSGAWLETLSQCNWEIKEDLKSLKEVINSSISLTQKQQIISKTLEEMEMKHSSHPLLPHFYPLCNRALPELNLEVPLKFDELQERDLQAVKEVLPLLKKKLFTITDFITVRQEFNEENVIANLAANLKKKSCLDGQMLIMLMFDFIKRRLPFADILLELKKDFSDLKLTTITMFDYLMRHSDPDLRALLVISCSQFMAIPFFFKSPWSTGNVIIDEHFYVFERSKSVLQVKLSKTARNLPKGSSEFLNQLLGKSFKTPSPSYASSGAIEIQYDFNCSSTEYILAADYHGQADPEIVQKLLPLFNVVIVHSFEGEKAFINKITERWAKQAQVIVYYHGQPQHSFTRRSRVTLGYQQPFLESQEKELIIRAYQQEMIDFFKVPLHSYVKDLLQRVGQKKLFIEVLKTLNCRRITQYQEFHEQVKKIVGLILSNDKDFQSTSFLPILHHITLRTEIQDKLAKPGLKEDQISQLKRVKKETEEDIKKCKPSKVVNCFIEVLEASNVMKMSFFLLHLIKGHIEQKTLSMESRKDQKVEGLKQLENDEPERLALLKEIAFLSKEIRKLQFSPEHVFREIYHLSQTDLNSNLVPDAQKYQLKQIEHGQPWELIDGDNLIFLSDQRKVFRKINNSCEDILVVSVIGPQSAGKSLLMNFIFGTQFLSSAGRCTKGIYACILPYRFKNGKTKNILILDTEGIQSAEAREKDTMFDKRIVYFIMCVSHVVLIVNKQEMNQRMIEVMKLVGDAILNTKQDLIENPSILIVMNMLPQIKSTTARDCKRTLENALEEENSDPRLKNVLALSLEQIFPFEFAFNRLSFGQGLPEGHKKTVNYPSPAISESIFNLRRTILDKFSEISSKRTSQFTLDKWFKFAERFWVFTGEFKGLIEYNSLSQKRKDLSLAKKVEELSRKYYMAEIFEQVQKEHDENLQELFKSSHIQKFENWSNKIKQQVQESFLSISGQVNSEFDQFCREKEIPSDLREKRRNQLSRFSDTAQQREFTRLNQRISAYVARLSKKTGDNNLRDWSTKLLMEQDSYSPQESEQLFEQGWEESIMKMKQDLKQKPAIKHDVFETIILEFGERAEIGAKSPEPCRQLVQVAENQGIAEMLRVQILELKTKALVSMKGTMIKNPSEVMNFDPQKKKYLTRFPSKGLVRCKDVTVVNLKPIHKKIVLEKDKNGILKMAKSIISQYCQELITRKLVDYSFFLQSNTQIKMEPILKQINDQYANFYLDPQLTTKQMESLLEEGLRRIQNKEEKKKEKKKKKGSTSFPCYDQIEAELSLVLEKYLDDLKNFGYCCETKKEASLVSFTQKILSREPPKFITIEGQTPAKKLLEFKNKIIEKDENLESSERIIQSKPTNKVQALCFNEQIKEYLEHLITLEKMPSDIGSEQSLVGFNNYIRWDIFFENLEKLVIKNARKDGKVEQGDSISHYLQVLSDENHNEEQKAQTALKFCQIGPSIIQDIVISVREQIDELNQELQPFWLEISNKGVASITQAVETMVIILGQALEIYNEMLPVRQFEQTKKREQKLFIAKLTCSNQESDDYLGQSIGEALVTFLQDKLMKKAASQFKKDLEDKKSHFEKAETIFNMESELKQLAHRKSYEQSYRFTQKDKDLTSQALQFYMNPTKFLESMFETKFDQLRSSLISSIRQKYELDLATTLEHLVRYFNALIQELKAKESAKNARCLFIYEKTPTNQNSALENSLFSEAFSLYFQRFMEGQWSDEDIIAVGEGVQLRKHPDIKLPRPANFRITLDSELIEQILDKVRGNPIFMLHNVLHSATKCIENALQDLSSQDPQNESDIWSTEIIGECMKNYKRLYTGCPSFCPMCRRQCDENHGNANLNDQIHRCKTGHQLQAFGGNRYSYNKKAITRSCSEIKEDEIVEYKNQEFKWAILKSEELTNWNYEEEEDAETQEIRERSRKIWNLIGKGLCREYNKAGVPIEFFEAKEDEASSGGKVHFIMALDESTSMTGEPWEQLMSALKTFLSELEDLKALGTKVSIIKYDGCSTIVSEKVDPQASIASNLTQGGGGTEFDPPLNDAFTLATKYKDEFDKIIIYFMTDGQASYTPEVVEKFHEPTLSHMIEFHAVSFGFVNSTQMQNLAKDMPNGQQTEAPNADDLRKSMLKIISNVFRS